MDSSLHDDLVKRTVSDETAAQGLSRVTKTQMVELTRDGGGRSPDAAAEILVHHAEGNIASAQVATEEYLDYLHLSKTSGNWRIVHDLFRHRTLPHFPMKGPCGAHHLLVQRCSVGATLSGRTRS
jgi:hypothetical protein